MDLAAAIQRASHYRNQLVLLCGDYAACIQKLQRYAEESGLLIANLNFELSTKMLEEPAQDRKRTSAILTEDWLRKSDGNPLLLSHIEFLFDSALGLDPIKVLLNSSKHKTIVAVWPGFKHAAQLSYASPGHHEYKNYKTSDLGETTLLHVIGD
jgi:hypothetical protein